MRQPIYDALCQKQADWYEKLQGHHRIGQSKKDDYGAVKITVKIIQPERETDISTEDSKQTEQTEKLWVWLLSDVLLRNESLRPTASVEDFRQALQQTLNAEGNDSIQLELSTPGEGLVSAMLRSHRVESWQTQWKLPRPSLAGIAAGSCMVFEVTSGKLDPQRLRQLELSGIGERTAEGYGQLCFNHPLLSEPLNAKKLNRKTEEALKSQEAELDTPPPLLSPSNRDSDVFKYARLIEKAAWREAIRRAALFLASESDRRTEILGIWIDNERDEPSQPSMSQLGGLRSVVSQLKFNQKEPVLSWIEHIREKRSNKWDGTRDGLGKIERLINEEEHIWNQVRNALQNAESNQNSLNYPLLQELTLTETGDADLKRELWAEAIQVVVYACIHAHKRELEPIDREQETLVGGAGYGA
ncbi:hypothetical protein O77CONTIG1_04783 [Leptolyngbya sp. O-77]|nr:hypothetical protein O77CONTIG1_04783 [Leptolyngbya sp. O-77]